MRWLLLLILILAEPALAQKRNRARTPAKPRAAVARPATPVVSGQVVKSLDVEGHRKIEKDAVLARLVTKVGDRESAALVREDILAVFRLGYFDDVQVVRRTVPGGVELTYRVIEKPAISEILYEGNTELKNDEIAEASGIKPYEILNPAKIRQAMEKVQKLYEDKGYFLARVEHRLEPIKEGETVRLVFNVVEGDKVKVKKIQFVGNKKLTSEYLKGRMMTQEEGYFSFMSGSGGFKQEAFERDTQFLRFMYYNQGYIQAKIDRPQVSVTPDKTGIYLTFRVEEGDQYEVGNVTFAGDLLFPLSELYAAIKIDENKVFAYDVLQRDMSEIQAKYGDLGYAFTNVVPEWEFLPGDRKVMNITFRLDKGSKVYFGRIDVAGNTKTRDKVVRRELKIREGELYHETRRRESQENVQRLGFFEEVNFKSSTPSDKLDVMNLEIGVKERNTGQVQVSAGYGSQTGLTFGGSVQQTNFMGKGQNLGVSMNLTNEFSMYDVSFNEPYLMDSNWSLGFRVFQSENSTRLDYRDKRTGGSVSLGHPITEKTRFVLSYGYTATRLLPTYISVDRNNDGTAESELLTDYDLFPLATAEGDASTMSAALEYDSRNDRMRPSSGTFARVSGSNAGFLGGNLRYYKASADYRVFLPVFWDVIFRNNLSWAKIGSVDNMQEPPFNELYLLGGPYSLRGFRWGRVGQMRQSQKLLQRYLADPATASRADILSRRWFGGQQQLVYMGEFQFPLIREAEMFGIMFFDIGQAEDEITESKFYSAWGFGLRWFSPIGPLRFEWGFPLRRDTDYHEAMVFEFSIGTPF